MMNIKNRGILLGLALLGATALTGFNSPASADRKDDLKHERKEVRDAQKDLRNADTPKERYEAKKDLRDAQQDLWREKRQNDNDRNDKNRWDNNNNGRWNNNDRHDNGRWDKNDNNNGRWGRNDNDRWDNNRHDRWDRNDRWDNNRNDRWDNNRWDNNHNNWPRNGNGGYGYGNGGYNSSTLEGIVTNDTPGNDFIVRLNNGQQIKVYAQRGESGAISRGDRVRVSGRYNGSTFIANSVSILNNRR